MSPAVATACTCGAGTTSRDAQTSPAPAPGAPARSGNSRSEALLCPRPPGLVKRLRAAPAIDGVGRDRLVSRNRLTRAIPFLDR